MPEVYDLIRTVRGIVAWAANNNAEHSISRLVFSAADEKEILRCLATYSKTQDWSLDSKTGLTICGVSIGFKRIPAGMTLLVLNGGKNATAKV